MLSLFPSLLNYQQVSPFLIRVTLGIIFLFWAYRSFRRNAVTTSNTKMVGIIEGLVGIALLIGIWTQIVALIAVVDMIVRLIDRIKNRAFLTDGVNYYLIVLIMAVSLLFVGPGFCSVDLPL